MKRKLILIAIVGTISLKANAQIDKQFSMFSETKIQINPAAAGFFKARYKLFANYRQQWWALMQDQPITSYSASFDGRFYEDLQEGRFVGGGIVFANDVAGFSGYTQLDISVPVNYSLRLDRFNTLSFGVAPGYFQRSIENRDLTWSNQWDNVLGFDQTLESGELLLNNRYLVGRFDLAAGLYWEFNYDDFTFMTLGVSGDHITRPKINFLPSDHRMNRTLNVHYFGNFGADDFPLTFRPNVMWTIQGSDQSLIFGTTIDILLRGESKMTGYYDRTSIELGGHFRYNDAVVGSFALNTGGLSFGVAYDFTISSISNITSYQGATEFFLYYRMGQPKGPGQIEVVDE